MRRVALVAALAVALTTAAAAQDKPNVAALLKQGYTIVGTVASPAGPGLFLLKDGDLILCFVAETPASAIIATQYCKPVR